MKFKVGAVIAAALLLLTSCGEESQPVVAGKVVSCQEINFDTRVAREEVGSGCLDGSRGGNVKDILGPAIINVWGSWCGPCKDEIPYFVEFYSTLNPSIQLIGVDVEEASVDDGREFVRTHGVTWPNLFDHDGSTERYFGNGVPVTWFIGVDGEVLYKKIGVISSADELRELSEKYLGAS